MHYLADIDKREFHNIYWFSFV